MAYWQASASLLLCLQKGSPGDPRNEDRSCTGLDARPTKFGTATLYLGAMPLLTDRAVVLRRLDYSETSQIVVLLTREHGQVRAIAKGIKRSTKTRFAAAIDLLELGQLVWSTRPDRLGSLSILTEWKQTKGFLGLRDRLERLYAAQYAVEITSELTTELDPHPVIFDALVNLLAESCTLSQPLAMLCGFQRTLLIEIGLMPKMDCCVGCGSTLDLQSDQPAYFSSHEGGLLCRNCEPAQVEKRAVPSSAARAVATGQITAEIAVAAFDLLNYHISHLMNKEPKLADFVVPSRIRRQLGTSAQ